MDDKTLSLADTFNMKNLSDRANLDRLLATVEEVRGDLLALRSELGASIAGAKVNAILQKIGA